MSDGSWESYQHRDAGKQAHENRLQTKARRFKEKLPLFGGGR